MIAPTYLTLPEAAQFLSDKTAQPVTANWLLRHASEEKLQMFFHSRQYVITGNADDAGSLKYYEPGKKYPLDKGWATLMIAHHSVNLQTLPDAKGKPSFVTDPNTEKRIKIPLVENDVYVLASEISLLVNVPDHKRPDYQKWKLSELWTITEAAHLLSDIEPIPLDTPFHLKNMGAQTSEIYRNIKHALEKGKISQHGKNRSGLVAGKKILPRDAVVWFANWCVNSSTFSLPDELWDLHPYKSRIKPEFKPNESLVTAMQAHLKSPYSSLPEYLRKHVDAAFSSSSEWDNCRQQWRLEKLDYYDLQNNPLREVESAAGWWDATMDASAWWSAESVTPLHAAMLLTKYNPNTENEDDAETNSSDEMGPEDFRRLKNTFEGALDKTKTLKAWVAYARDHHLKFHSWISEWEAWIKEVGMTKENMTQYEEHVAPPPPTSDEGSAGQFNAPKPMPVTSAAQTPVVKQHKLKSRRHPLDTEIEAAKKIASNPNDCQSVWTVLTRLAEQNPPMGDLCGYSSDGIQYRGKRYQDTQEPDVFTKKNLRDRMLRESQRGNTR